MASRSNFRDGTHATQETAWALIGADGVWSALRHQLFPDAKPLFSGLIAWRGTIEAAQLPREMTARRVQLWMGPDAHLVAIRYRAGADQHGRGCAGRLEQPGWSAAGDAADIKRRFAQARWPEPARDDRRRERWRKWALFTIPPMPAWHRDATALLGDAAHAMLPFAAQGAGMAIEDAAVLAHCLGEAADENADGAAAALARYTGLRRARVARFKSSRNGTDGFSISREPPLWRAILPSGQWDRSVCWRVRTGSTTGALNRSGFQTEMTVIASSSGIIKQRCRSASAVVYRHPAAGRVVGEAGASSHLSRRHTSSASLAMREP